MFQHVLRRQMLCLVLLIAACGTAPLAGNAVTIKDITSDPRTYVGKSVLIEGAVSNVMSLVLARYFVIDDGTGTMTVITDKPLPGKGQRMRVLGKVSDFFSLGTGSTLVLIEDRGETVPRGGHMATNQTHREP